MLLTDTLYQTLEQVSAVKLDSMIQVTLFIKGFVIQGGALACVCLSDDIQDVSLHREDNCTMEHTVV